MFNFIKKKSFFKIFFILQSILLFLIIKFYHNYNTYYYHTYALIFADRKIVNDLQRKTEELHSKYKIHKLPEKGSINLQRWFHPKKEINIIELSGKSKFVKELEYYFESNNYIKSDSRIIIYFIQNKNEENLTIHAENFWNDVKKFMSIPNCDILFKNFNLEYKNFLEKKNSILKSNLDKEVKSLINQEHYNSFKLYIENQFIYYPKIQEKILQEIDGSDKQFLYNEICFDVNKRIVFLNSKEKNYKINTFNLINLYLLSISVLLIINFFLIKIYNEFKKK
jgi:hypothetical protein